MGYWDEDANIDTYETMADGYDGRALVEYLQAHVPAGSTVLELGMGPGKDLDMLAETFKAAGSDASQIFVDRYRARNPSGDVFLLDATTLDTDRRFDALYSNKVLQHLTREAFQASLRRQAEVVRPGGVVLHALWYGDSSDVHHGMLFNNYTEDSLKAALPPEFEVVDLTRYEEMAPNDSLRVHLRRRD
ncbi:MAG: class I SAM-dependent methyltransferase [Myxococcota bacterium]